MSRNNDHITGSLLEYLYHQKYYKHIGTDYEDKKNTSVPQEMNILEKLEEEDGAIMFFLGKK